jgi:hypothetical protein
MANAGIVTPIDTRGEVVLNGQGRVPWRSSGLTRRSRLGLCVAISEWTHLPVTPARIDRGGQPHFDPVRSSRFDRRAPEHSGCALSRRLYSSNVTCPKCRGTREREIGPGYFECITFVDDTQVFRVPAPPGHPYEGFGWQDVTSTSMKLCGHRYHVAVVGTGSMPVCACGLFAIGTCTECGTPVCRQPSCSAVNPANRLVCIAHQTAPPAPDWGPPRGDRIDSETTASKVDNLLQSSFAQLGARQASAETAAALDGQSNSDRQVQWRQWAREAAARLTGAAVTPTPGTSGWLLYAATAPTTKYPAGETFFPLSKAKFHKSIWFGIDSSAYETYTARLFVHHNGDSQVACLRATPQGSSYGSPFEHSVLFHVGTLEPGVVPKSLHLVGRDAAELTPQELFSLSGLDALNFPAILSDMTAKGVDRDQVRFQNVGMCEARGLHDAATLLQDQLVYWELGLRLLLDPAAHREF